jgi:ferredoxin
MTFNNAAAAVIRNETARQVEAAECLDLLHQAYESNLIQGGENVRQKVSFICNCCACCCEGLIVARKFGRLHPVQTTNYLPVIQANACSGCSKCVQACPVEALNLVTENDPRAPTRKKPNLDERICLGCGVCTRVCPSHAIILKARPQRVITPADTLHRTVLMAIERGQLQNLIFDNQALASQRAMAAVLGAILRLPPINQILASRQMQSRYLEALISRIIDFFDDGDSWLGQLRSKEEQTANTQASAS